MESVQRDLTFAVRSLQRGSAFGAVVCLTLAVGIGSATATFSVANGILLRPLPVADQDRVVVLWGKQRDFAHVPLRWAEVNRYARESRAFARVAGIDYNGAWTWAMTDRGEAAPANGTFVTGELFHTLGVQPQLGRVIESADDRPNAPVVAVISDALWRRRYGRDRSVIGRILEFDRKQVTIVGVAPAGFEYPHGVEIWTAVLPFSPTAQSDTAPGSLDMVARLRPDATLEQGRRELDAFLDRAYVRWRASIGKFEATARPLRDVIVGGVRQAVFMLTAAGLLVLFIACMNVANLLLVRGVTRTREVAIRASLGATPRRIIRQLLTEASVFAVVGGALGVVLAAAMVRGLVTFAPAEIPRLGLVTLDLRVVAFAGVATMLSLVLSAVGPAIALTRWDIGTLLRRAGTRSATGSRAATRTKQTLIVAQAMLAVFVLAGAALLVRSLVNLQRQDLGFDRSKIIVAQLTLPWSKFDTPDGSDRYAALLDQLQEAVGALPGVTGVSVVTSPPYSGTGGWDALPGVEGQNAQQDSRRPWVNMEIVTRGYFETLGVPLIRGRYLSATDRKGAAPVAVVNETMARLYWPGEEAIGKRLRMGAFQDSAALHYTVVGVVGDMRYRELTTAMPSLYLPNEQYVRATPTFFVVRTRLGESTRVPPLRRTFSSIDPDALLLSTRTMADYLAGPLARPRFASALIACFAIIGVILVAIGVYAVVGEHVRQHRRELGIRIALGARAADVRRVVIRIGVRPMLLGAAIGLLAAVVAAHVARSQLYGVTPADPLMLGSVAAVVVIVAVVACAAPVRNAARLDAVEVLRSD